MPKYLSNQPFNNLHTNCTETCTNWGIGVFFPHTTKIVYYTFEGGGDHVDPKGFSCSYFAPVIVDAITPNKTYDYTVYITMGSAEQIRDTFTKIKDAQK